MKNKFEWWAEVAFRPFLHYSGSRKGGTDYVDGICDRIGSVCIIDIDPCESGY